MLAISTFETSRATIELDGKTVTVEQRSKFPQKGSSTITFHVAQPAAFIVRVRAFRPGGDRCVRKPAGKAVCFFGGDGWATLPLREWRDGDQHGIASIWRARLIPGEYGNKGLAALAWGPFVLAYDEKLNPGLPAAGEVGLVRADPPCKLKAGGSRWPSRP